MKFIDRLIYWIFSVIMLVLSVLCIYGFLNLFGIGGEIFKLPASFYESITDTEKIYGLAISAFILLLSIKGMFFQKREPKEKGGTILLKNNNGKLSISKETIENLVRGSVMDIEGIELLKADSYLNKKGSLGVNVEIVILKEVNIKEVTKTIQEEVKYSVKQMTDVDVNDINVTVKNISNKAVKKKDKKNNKEEKFEKMEKVEEKEELEEKTLKKEDKE